LTEWRNATLRDGSRDSLAGVQYVDTLVGRLRLK